MKKIITLFVLVFITSAANAALINITTSPDGTFNVLDIAKNSNPTGSNSNSPDNHTDWLNDYVIPGHNALNGTSYSLIDGTGIFYDTTKSNDSVSGSHTFDLTDVVYITYHYGKGRGGSGAGGGIVAYYNDGMTGDFTPPSSGSGPNGLGGLSTVYVWSKSSISAPDAGSTLALMGIALAGLGALKRRK